MSKSWRYRNPSPDQRPGNPHPDPEAIDLIQRSLGRLTQNFNADPSAELTEADPSRPSFPTEEPPAETPV